MTHTPGPWFASPTEGQRFAHVSPEEHLIIPDVFPGSICTAWGTDGNALANARLIAAAPDMLEALKKLQGRVQPQYRSIIDAAIAKATGAP